LYALRIVDTRANLLQATDLLEQAALDPYAFTRDAYLQLRQNRSTVYGTDRNTANSTDSGADDGVNDGRLPEESEDIDTASAPASAQTP
jgi:phospholipid-binding lipoprotein MlaA